MTFASTDDPYRDRKKYHRAALWGPGGRVSALCFKRPRAINLEHALWTICDEAVTCKACRREMKRRGVATEVPDAE
jgi:hypothetical protein